MSPRAVKRPEAAHITALKEKRAAQEARKQARARAVAAQHEAKLQASRPKVYDPFAGVDLARLQREHAMLRKQATSSPTSSSLLSSPASPFLPPLSFFSSHLQLTSSHFSPPRLQWLTRFIEIRRGMPI